LLPHLQNLGSLLDLPAEVHSAGDAQKNQVDEFDVVSRVQEVFEVDVLKVLFIIWLFEFGARYRVRYNGFVLALLCDPDEPFDFFPNERV
jgi:hypothetical protein